MPRTITIDIDSPDEDWVTVYETVRRAELGLPDPHEGVEIGPKVPDKGSE